MTLTLHLSVKELHMGSLYVSCMVIDDLMTRNYCVESVRRFDLKPHTSKVLGLTYHTQSPTTDLPPQQKYSSDLSLFCFALK